MANANTFKARHLEDVRTFITAYQQLVANREEFVAQGGGAYSQEATWPDVENANNDLTKTEFDDSFYAIEQLQEFMQGQDPDVNFYRLFFYQVAA